MSDKAIFVKVKNVQEAMYLELLEKSGYGWVHDINTARENNPCVDEGEVLAIATSCDSQMINELDRLDIEFYFLDNFYPSQGEKIYKSLGY